MKKYIPLIVNIIFIIVVMYLLKDTTEVALHFDLEGNVDRFGSKFELLFVLSLPMFVYYLFKFIEVADPKKHNLRGMNYNYLKLITYAFMWLITLLITYAAVFPDALNFKNIILLTVALLMFCISYVIPNIKQNYTVGVKTPWTLANEEVWDLTHKHARYTFIVIGFSIILLMFESLYIITFIILISALIELFYYSYKSFKTR